MSQGPVSCVSVAFREVSPTTKEMYQLCPKVCASCVSYIYTTKGLSFAPPEQIRKRTNSASRKTTHIHTQIQINHPTSKFSTFSATTYIWSAWHFLLCFRCFCSYFNVYIDSWFNHSAFFDTKPCWFILASVHLFKIHYKHETRSDEFPLKHYESSLQDRNEL